MTLLMIGGHRSALAQPDTASQKIGSGVIEALQVDGHAHVMIMLAEPVTMSRGADLTTMRKAVAKAQGAVLGRLYASDYSARRTYQTIPALAGRVTQTGLAKLVADPTVVKIDLDVGGTGSLATSVPLIGVDTRHAQGITGKGVVVAVLDSGLDTDHSDLADDLIHQECFLDFDGTIDGVGRCPNGSDRQSGAGAAEDLVGHGTHVTGIITSKGSQSSVGVAPDAKIVAIKVTDDTAPFGTFQFFSEIVAALEFIITSRSM
jgi:subtilisin family serine protease